MIARGGSGIIILPVPCPRERDISDRTILETIRQAPSRHDLQAIFSRHVTAEGFNAYAVGSLPMGGDAAARTEPFLLIDWPSAWLELYAREGFARADPAIARALRDPRPFTWRDLTMDEVDEGARIIDAARAFGWHDGLVIPIGPEQSGTTGVGIVSLASPATIDLDDNRRRHLVEIAVATYRRGSALCARARDDVRLSPREAKVLSLVAEGHDDATIATLLCIAKATAHFHIERAKRRLGATTRAQAVALALRRGLLRI